MGHFQGLWLLIVVALLVAALVGPSAAQEPACCWALLGDANGDGVVDVFDLSLLATHFGTADPTVDFNCDGVVNERDYLILKAQYGAPGPLLRQPFSIAR